MNLLTFDERNKCGKGGGMRRGKVESTKVEVLFF
jgi:hypothetical protein